jgi:DNA-binding NarL/FixJ family response regulator
MGRLSNPPEVVERLIFQRSSYDSQAHGTSKPASRRTSKRSIGTPPEEKGRLSNPIQRRLSGTEIAMLADLYICGSSIREIACRFGIHRTTVLNHLEARGVSRRRMVRKMSDAQVIEAASRYASGRSLFSVASDFEVHEQTLTREFRKAGVPIRPRRGWNP